MISIYFPRHCHSIWSEWLAHYELLNLSRNPANMSIPLNENISNTNNGNEAYSYVISKCLPSWLKRPVSCFYIRYTLGKLLSNCRIQVLILISTDNMHSDITQSGRGLLIYRASEPIWELWGGGLWTIWYWSTFLVNMLILAILRSMFLLFFVPQFASLHSSKLLTMRCEGSRYSTMIVHFRKLTHTQRCWC